MKGRPPDPLCEGLAMKNCCGSLAKDCKLGDYQLFSVVKKDSKIRQATVGLRKKGEIWTLAAVKGTCNSNVGIKMMEIAQLILQQSNGSEAQEDQAGIRPQHHEREAFGPIPGS